MSILIKLWPNCWSYISLISCSWRSDRWSRINDEVAAKETSLCLYDCSMCHDQNQAQCHVASSRPSNEYTAYYWVGDIKGPEIHLGFFISEGFSVFLAFAFPFIFWNSFHFHCFLEFFPWRFFSFLQFLCVSCYSFHYPIVYLTILDYLYYLIGETIASNHPFCTGNISISGCLVPGG